MQRWLVGAARSGDAIPGALSYLGDPAAAPLTPAEPPAEPEGLTFVLAERYALLWATTWAGLTDADANAAGWMKLAAAVRG